MLYTRIPSLYFTHSFGVLNPWICTSRSLYVILLIRYSEKIIGILRRWSLLLDHSFRYFLTSLFLLILWFCAFDSVLVIFLYSSVIMYEHLYVLLQWLSCHHTWLIYLVQITLGSACIRGVFFSRIYVADSRRDYVFTYFRKRDVTPLITLI